MNSLLSLHNWQLGGWANQLQVRRDCYYRDTYLIQTCIFLACGTAVKDSASAVRMWQCSPTAPFSQQCRHALLTIRSLSYFGSILVRCIIRHDHNIPPLNLCWIISRAAYISSVTGTLQRRLFGWEISTRFLIARWRREADCSRQFAPAYSRSECVRPHFVSSPVYVTVLWWNSYHKKIYILLHHRSNPNLKLYGNQ